MPIIRLSAATHASGTGRPVHSRGAIIAHVVGSIVIGGWALLGLAGGTLAQSGPARLSEPSVSPRTALSTTLITFEVLYRNPPGADASQVVVRVAGAAHPLDAVTSTSNHDPSRYRASFRLPVGTWPVTFEADDGHFSTSLDAGSVTVSAPLPDPTPTPKPTPKPTPEVTPRPTPKPTTEPTPAPTRDATPSPSGGPSATAAPVGPGPTPGPGDKPDATAAPSGAASPSLVPAPATDPGRSADPLTAGGGPGASFDPGSPTAAGGVGTDGPSDAGTTGAGPRRDGPNGAGSPSGGSTWAGAMLASAWLPPILGGSDLSTEQRVLATTITTATSVGLAMAFALFGKRRRDSEPTAPDEVLSERASRFGPPADGTLVAATAPAPIDAEAALPRWRRPSLLEARRSDPTRTVSQHHTLTFEEGVIAPVPGLERRRIRYRVVRLLDGPDELLANEIGLLDEDDQVQLLERSGSFWKVLCPDGRVGWVHRMVLGETIDEGHDAIDPDVLAAVQAARASRAS